MDVEGVAEWILTVIPDKDLAERYADGLRDGFVDGDTMDNFPMGGDELTGHGIQKTEEALQVHSREVGEADRRRRSEC